MSTVVDAAPVGPAAQPASPRSRAGWSRGLHLGWFLASGYLLLLAPVGDLVWNESFWQDRPVLWAILHRDGVRHAVSAFGGVLLVAAFLEAAGILVERDRKRRA